MIGPTGMATFGPGPFYSDGIMGQASSSPTREPRQALPNHQTASRRSALATAEQEQEEEDIQALPRYSQDFSRDSWSMQYDCTDQPPYTPAVLDSRQTGSKMMTQTSLLTLPKANPSHDLAFFLRTTGPTSPQRRPSKPQDHSPRTVPVAGREALGFLRRSQRRSEHISKYSQKHANHPPATSAEPCLRGTPDDLRILNSALRDEGGLLKEDNPPSKVPRGVLQKVSTTGKKYYALQIPSTVSEEVNPPEKAPPLSPDLLDSHVAVSFSDDVYSRDVLDGWFMSLNHQQPFRPPPSPPRKSSTHLPMDECTARTLDVTPIRPAASNPPTPDVESLMPAALDAEVSQARSNFTSNRCNSYLTPADPGNTTPPILSLPLEEAPARHRRPHDDVEIRHPTPRRFASQPLLLQRGSSIRSVSGSPGPPPRSPLRLRREAPAIESAIPRRELKSAPKVAPNIRGLHEMTVDGGPIKATVTTNCTGPIKRPRSRDSSFHENLRTGRQARTRTRKMRDRPNIAAMVHGSNARASSRQLLASNGPKIQIPELRPAPFVTRQPSVASSIVSWKKITESMHTPISPTGPQNDSNWITFERYRTPVSSLENQPKSHFSPISPAHSIGIDSNMTLSPVMLVAEEVPLQRSRLGKPAKLIVKELGKHYAPRPRSASIKRRSRPYPSRPQTPSNAVKILLKGEEAPPLPSPPPNRALPPTPPRSGSEKVSNMKARRTEREPPSCPPSDMLTQDALPQATNSKRASPHHHIRTSNTTTTNSGGDPHTSQIDARLGALEKQNALLSAALMAVLRTNGTYNLPITAASEGLQDDNGLARALSAGGSTAWENRIARRSAVSGHHTPSSSNGSALEMYLSTRGGKREDRTRTSGRYA